ncbi:hypothetical protein Q763_16655 [Flavobacterium beibuense F44-8]|uniref:Apea-like HEPN domain-containing protein n=1 Tax=Flavobacterium beibuense F44-8 TaxID=1406840 RepID=A0A0A2LFB7_9FLAO|nr:hypothetical protein [Flavobacterium beibuense]KGO78817.1 hypothetical protein Q763_16655 [Flavobacterium beibuense F44-8]
MNQRIEKEIKQIEILLEYLELMSAILPNFDYRKMLSHADTTRFFLKEGSKLELNQQLPKIKELLEKQTKSLMKDYPPKVSIIQIADKFRTLKKSEDIINTGVTFAFLNELMDLAKLNWYADTPYHYRIAIGPLKGGGGIEEEFLLKDAFVLLQRAETNYELLEQASVQFRNREHLDIPIHRYITDIKYDVANYSRQSVLTFFSFIECLVNSIGFDYLYRHEKSLSVDKVLKLKGLKKNGGYMNLRNRIEVLQTVIRRDGKIVLNLTDNQQRKEPFLSFFDRFEALRNASVHYSPIKHRIWLGPKDWINQARTFCDIALQVGIEIWKACYPESDGPQYMGKLDKSKQLNLADERLVAATALTNLINQDKNSQV